MKIFVTRKIPGDHLEELKTQGFEVDVSELDRPLSPEELLAKSKGVDAIFSLLTDKIDGDLMDAIGPQLKIISNYAVGFDNVDVKGASDRGIIVTNTPSTEVNEAVAEHTWVFIMALSRRVVGADEFVRVGIKAGNRVYFWGHLSWAKPLGLLVWVESVQWLPDVPRGII